MIDQNVFKQAWALLCERFGREQSDVLMKAYFDDLSADMDTNSFRLAVRYVFRNREFFPRPIDFIDAVRPDTEAVALSQWEEVQELMGGDDTAFYRLAPEAQRVVRMIGGVGTLRITELDRVPFVRREFFQLYGQTAEVARREAQERVTASKHAGEIARAAMQGSDAVLALAGRRDDE